jgi:diguanylate cyclase (GGDEF)-like protein
VSVASAISASVRAIDLVARFGGDEFTVLLPDTEVAEATRVAERVLARLARDAHGSTLGVSVSVGMASLGATTSSADALKEADTALYDVKAAGGGRAAFARGSQPRLAAVSGLEMERAEGAGASSAADAQRRHEVLL